MHCPTAFDTYKELESAHRIINDAIHANLGLNLGFDQDTLLQAYYLIDDLVCTYDEQHKEDNNG